MAKLKKHAEVLSELQKMISKKADAQATITGAPGHDTNITSISPSTEETDQNSVGPEELNSTQGPAQCAATDDSEPATGAKVASADDISKIAERVLADIQKSLEKGAASKATGVPGKDTNITSISDETETVAQNAVKPEQLNSKQGPEQKGSTDSSEPAKKASVDSAELGRIFIQALQKKAADYAAQSDEVEKTAMLKAAGRADLDSIVFNALQELENEKTAAVQEEESEKIAEAQGAAYFDFLMKEAQLEQVVNYAQTLEEKVAAMYEELESFRAVEAEKTAAAKQKHDEDALALKVASIIRKELESASK